MPTFQLQTNLPKSAIPPNFHSELTAMLAENLGKPETVRQTCNNHFFLYYRPICVATFEVLSQICAHEVVGRGGVCLDFRANPFKFL